MMDVHYCCPTCHGELLLRQDSYSCAECAKRYPVLNRVPDFRDTDFYWGAIEREKMRKILEHARMKGWKEALEVFIKNEKPGFHDYILDPARSYWHLVLPLPEQSTVLDLGCGWGSISFPLARDHRRVFALDFTKEKVEFVSLRCQQSGIDNIYPLCSSGLTLPFTDGYFDLVVVYGVLEWMGLSDEKKRPEFTQIRLLREIYRVLKKGGFLYLSIENRWSVMNFMGYPEPHTDLRFISLLPRFLADVYSRMARGVPYRIYTHSLKVYEKMFEEAGFPEVDAYAPLPSYRNFYYLLPLRNPAIMPYFLNYLSSSATPLSTHLLNLARRSHLYGLIKYVVPDYSFVATK